MKNLLITGSGRSGTSMLAGTFDNGEYFLGEDLYGAREANPKGFYENAEINSINEAIVQRSVRLACPPSASRALLQRYRLGQLWLASLPLGLRFIAGDEERHRIASLVGQRPFCFKDPRFCFTLEPWLEAAPDTLVLCIFRDPSATVESILKECRTAPYLFDLDVGVTEAFSLWRQLYWRLLDRARRLPNIRFIHYDDLFDGEKRRQLAGLADARLNDSFPEAQLRRSSATIPADSRSVAVFEVMRTLSENDFGAPSPQRTRLIDDLDTLLFGDGSSRAEENAASDSGEAEPNAAVHFFLEAEGRRLLEESNLRLREFELQTAAQEGRIKAVQQQLDAARGELDAARGELGAVYHSLSWRCSAPLRMIDRAITSILPRKPHEEPPS